MLWNVKFSFFLIVILFQLMHHCELCSIGNICQLSLFDILLSCKHVSTHEEISNKPAWGDILIEEILPKQILLDCVANTFYSNILLIRFCNEFRCPSSVKLASHIVFFDILKHCNSLFDLVCAFQSIRAYINIYYH